MYGNYRSLWLPEVGASPDADPVIQELDKVFNPGPYGTMLFLNETTAIAPNGIEM